MAAVGEATKGERKTAMLPSILSPYNRRARGAERFAQAYGREPAQVCRDAGGAARDQRGEGQDRQHGLEDQAAARLLRRRRCRTLPRACRRCAAAWRSRNVSDSFRTVFEQVLEDMLVGGFGAVEMEATGDAERPFHLWAVDGATIEIDPHVERRSCEAALRAGCRATSASAQAGAAAGRRVDVHAPESADATRRSDWAGWRLRSRR